jgi:hypothetical protein
MKLSITSKMMLFLSSYSLLFVALTFKYKLGNFTWIFIVLAVLGGIATIKITKTKINPDNREVINIVSKNDQVLSYLVSYLLPFIGFDLTQSNEFVALIIIFLTIGVLYIKADLIYINPLLLLFGFNIYEAQFINGSKRILISRKNVNEIKLLKNIKFYELEDRSIIIENDSEEERSNE